MALGVELPITADSGDGFTMLYSIRRTLHQNFKMLILTNPGERIMDIRFGVGLQMYLFEQGTNGLNSKITSRINQQVNLYMPFIIINKIIFHDEQEQGLPLDSNRLEMTINYSVPALGTNDFLDISL